MSKILAALALAAALALPLSASAALTRGQADSLVAVVKASPTTATSLFVPLITAFSSITNAQATALINVIKAAPSSASSVFSDMLLAFTGTSVIDISDSASATITSPTTRSSGNFSVTGTFSNTNASSAIVVLVGPDVGDGAAYSGPIDWGTIGGGLEGRSTGTIGGHYLYSYSNAVTGASHQFSVSFSGIPTGSYEVLIYTGTYGNQTFLTQGTLTVTTTSQPHASIDSSSLTVTSAKDAVTPLVTGTAKGVTHLLFAYKGMNSTYATVSGGTWSTTFPESVSTGSYAVEVIDNDSGSASYGNVLATGTLTVTTGTLYPSCTVSYSPSHVYRGQAFTLSWTSKGIAYTAPYNQTGPTIRTTNHYGTTGVILYGASGSQKYMDSAVETMKFQLGLGGFSGNTFTSYCSTSVPIVSDGSTGTGTIIGNTATPDSGFVLKGTVTNGSTDLNVVIVDGTYSGSRAWSAVQALIVPGKDLPDQSTAVVSNGSWTAAMAALPEGEYTVLVYDDSPSTPVLITSGELYATYKG